MQVSLLKGSKGYWSLFLFLLVTVFLEWGVFLAEVALPILPVMMSATFIKFALVVLWHMNLESDPGWQKKSLLALLLCSGGLTIGFIVTL